VVKELNHQAHIVSYTASAMLAFSQTGIPGVLIEHDRPECRWRESPTKLLHSRSMTILLISIAHFASEVVSSTSKAAATIG
jgi:hypothetical protein